MKNLGILASSILIIAVVLLQTTFGNIDLQIFAFPINIALLIALIGISYVIQREKGDTFYVKKFASAQTSVLLIVIFFIETLLIALAPQLEIQHSWLFNVTLILLLSNLQLSIMTYRGRFKNRFYLNHVGIYIFIVALSFGAPDTQKLRAIISEGETIEYAYDYKGKPQAIGFPLSLDKFEVSYYKNNIPRTFKATVRANDNTKEILVNHPWNYSWQKDIYLVSHGVNNRTQEPYCVLEFVRQPWKHLVSLGLILTAIGSFMLFWGKKFN